MRTQSQVSPPLTIGYKFAMIDSLMTSPTAQRDRWRRATAVLLGVAIAVIAQGARAQQSTAATYEDWTLRCSTSASSPPQKSCDIEQLSHLQNNEQPFSRVTIPRPEKGKPVLLAIQVPVNVWLATGIRIEVGGKDAGLSAPFTRCGPAGCFASITLNDAAVQTFRAGTAPAAIVFANAAQQQVTIPLSFKGFSQAFDALARE
jgi:invasion protein IalB